MNIDYVMKRIHHVNASNEQRFAAAMVASAVREATDGDSEAYEWLRDAACLWLTWIMPDYLDIEDVHARLLEMIEVPAKANVVTLHQVESPLSAA